MRTKIDYGIDLGTTNSAIARMENGNPVIKKSDSLKDTVPSCVHINRRQDILVGDPAFNVMKNDSARALKNFETGNTNTFIEFKRTMGTTAAYKSSNMGKSFSSEELSSEVLKKLKSLIQDENMSSIVITVPAKFLNPQKEATVQAAKLAGFKHIELLQEPVAAATAYGLTAKDKDSYWLVFDFGGGTFDAALIKSEEGILTVKDTEGNNRLGGKNLDEAIVDQIIIPHLRKNYAIENILHDTDKKEILRNAVKYFAEEAKIQLSFKNSHNILSNLGDLPFEDENGNEPEIDITVTQKDMERVFSLIFQEAIDISKYLLQRNNLEGSDLGALILVGGPTYSPILRRMLKEQITEKIDASIDPMTVVAKGAALFASTISISEEVKEITRDKTKLQIDINYESTSVDTQEWINIKVLKEKTTGWYPEKMYVDVVRSDGAWSSGKKLLGEKAILVDVILQEGCSNAFKVYIYNEQGNQLECQPNQFSILQGIGGLDSLSTLPYYIGIGKRDDIDEKEIFYPAKGVEKNRKLPATGVINGLKTSKTVHPGIASDIIRIPIYQGDYNAEGSNPLLNNWVTDVIISGENIPVLLPEGSPVDITIKVDRSEQMLFSAYFSTIDHTEELKIQIKQAEPPTVNYLTAEIAIAKQAAISSHNADIAEQIEILKTQLENEKGNIDGRFKILDGLRRELLKLDRAQKTNEWYKVEKELKEAFSELESLIEKIKANGDDEKLKMDKVNAHVLKYQKKIEQIVREENRKAAKELIQEIGQIDFEITNIVSENAGLVQIFQHICNEFNAFKWKDANQARQLVNQGMQMVVTGRNSEIRPILVQIINLMPDNEKDKFNELLS